MSKVNDPAEMLNEIPGMVFQGALDASAFFISFASEGCTTLTGYNPSEFTNSDSTNFINIIHTDDREYFLRLIDTTVRKGLPLETTVRITTKTGAEKSIWFSCRTTGTNKFGMPCNIEGIAVDISTQLRNEAVKYANRSKTVFLSRVSREVRASMSSILGIVNICLMKDDPNHIRENASEIKASGNKLLSVMSGVLDYIRMENNDAYAANDDYSLAALLTDIITAAKPKVEAAGLRFNVKVDEKLPNWLCGDADKLKQAILLLISNSVKFTDIGYIALNVKGTADGDSSEIAISVEDTGRGIKNEDIENIYNEFTQFDEKSTEGLGIGLAVVQGLMKLLGGEVVCSSMYGLGSIFTIKLTQQVSASNTSTLKENIDIKSLLRKQTRARK